MKKVIQLCVLFVCYLFLALSSVLAGENDSDSSQLYMTKFCITCHGQKGIAIAPNYPNLAKQNKQYLINQVKDIIAKKRANKLTVLMTLHPVINSIHDDEITDIATYMNTIQ